MSGDRVSPIDGVNMNRAFPGRRDGSVSEMIAHFVYSKIIPLVKVAGHPLGRKTMMFSPFVAYHRLEDRELTGKRAPGGCKCSRRTHQPGMVELDSVVCWIPP
ncbi:MAG: hypothetical protein Ct9H300mP16_03860 [Pseudomonadota bacterium]|nr:MAG: hypothetical protein Ct9H300mP16_03860 [Pseudomonadota bacterium]